MCCGVPRPFPTSSNLSRIESSASRRRVEDRLYPPFHAPHPVAERSSSRKRERPSASQVADPLSRRGASDGGSGDFHAGGSSPLGGGVQRKETGLAAMGWGASTWNCIQSAPNVPLGSELL